uniref:50S ribosomal protein L10 n=1 Tax=Taenia asiatica TaxID=60517 RepID=A0A0R3WGW0_TAEAS
LMPFVGTLEVGEAAVGQCDVESADAVGGGDE